MNYSRAAMGNGAGGRIKEIRKNWINCEGNFRVSLIAHSPFVLSGVVRRIVVLSRGQQHCVTVKLLL